MIQIPGNDIFIALATWLRQWMLSIGLDVVFVDIVMALIRALMLAIVALVVFIVITWLERKVVARIQDRIGPNLAGPWGILQPIADAIKAITKEDTTPAGADVHIFNAAPILSAVAAVLVYAVLPFGPNPGGDCAGAPCGPMAGTDMSIGLFYVLAVGAVSLIAVLMAGWSSNNKYALLGAFRAVAELLSYEVPQVLSIAAMVMIAGTMNMTQIVEVQTVPFIFPLFVTALVFFVSGLAEAGRSPFDLVEAESEIVAGYHIEYSGMKFSLFFLGEFVHAFAVCAVITTVFLNGWQGPILPGWVWFFVKSFAVYFIMMWIKFTMPRFRIDQLMAFNWKFLVPVSLLNLLMLAVGDTVLKSVAITRETNPLLWGGILFMANLALLFVAMWALGRSARKSRLDKRPIVARVEDVKPVQSPVVTSN
ncbi:NADH-quinone oxidoreductase subunit H [Thermoflexales bacterium]|nr:NADH-quinone oxidoreductase subunit H [Thermoflexales bacterium]